MKIEVLKKKLAKVELELDKCRTSSLRDGWQTQRHAKKQQRWNYYAALKNELRAQIYELEEA